MVIGYQYDPVGRLTGLGLDFAGTASDVAFAYAYNPASQIVSRSISNDLYVFAKAASSTAYAVNGLNQYTEVGGGAVVHDRNGNLTQEGGRNLAYDSENRLTAITTPQNYSLEYDPQGRFRALAFGGVPAAMFDMVGTDVVALRTGAGALVDRQVFGPGVDEPMVAYDSAGARTYYHADGHGNIVARSDGSGGAILRIAYDEYGRPSATGSRFLHAGKMLLGGINAYYNNARFYDYRLGRFLQTDPVGYKDQMNLYAYVGNDPVNRSDPSGLRIHLDGSEDERKRFINLAYRLTGVRLREGKDGQLEKVGARNSKQGEGAAAHTLIRALNSKQNINIDAVRESSTVVGDNWVTDEFDTADFEKFESRSPKFAAAMFAHVMEERRFASTHVTGFTTFENAHRAAMGPELQVMGRNYRDSPQLPNAIIFNYYNKNNEIGPSFSFTESELGVVPW